MSERFPRQKLFGRIADLQEEVSHWNAESLKKLREAEDHGYSVQVQTAFRERAESLHEVWQLLSDARSTMYYCR